MLESPVEKCQFPQAVLQNFIIILRGLRENLRIGFKVILVPVSFVSPILPDRIPEPLFDTVA